LEYASNSLQRSSKLVDQHLLRLSAALTSPPKYPLLSELFVPSARIIALMELFSPITSYFAP
jgi:hypothetical protein